MARFVIATRRAGVFDDDEKTRRRQATEEGYDRLFRAGSDLVGDRANPDPLARGVKVFDAEPDEVARKAEDLGDDVIVEREIRRFPLGGRVMPPELRTPALSVPEAAGSTFTVRLQQGQRWVGGVDCELIVNQGGGGRGHVKATSAPDGSVSFPWRDSWQPSVLLALPYANFWSVYWRQPAPDAVFQLQSLPVLGLLRWWHLVLGEQRFNARAGAGVKVGVCDTGCGPHAAVRHVTLCGAFVDGSLTPGDAAMDVDEHGTHVSGSIAGRVPSTARKPAGTAPGCDLFVARVFGGPQSGASQADIVNGIDELSRSRQVDVLNLSLGSSQSSQIESDAMRDASERGTLVVAAAGNDGGPVGFPAGYDDVVCVAALGMDATIAANGLSALNKPPDRGLHGRGGLWATDFSNHGAQVDLIAPGNATISTVPSKGGWQDPYTSMDGTSMASPQAAAAAAVLLANHAEYRALPRGRGRTEAARAILLGACQSIGIPAEFEGRGVPHT